MNLRERRRHETESAIGNAALDLFLAKGVAATTVEEIAAAAGVSPRTFFRYFDTKESAALPGLRVFREQLALLSPAGPGMPDLIAALDEVFLAVIDLGEGDGRNRVLDFYTLFAREPGIRDAAGAHEARMAQELLETLTTHAPDADPLALRLVVNCGLSMLGAVWQHWFQLTREEGRDSVESPQELYRRACDLRRQW